MNKWVKRSMLGLALILSLIALFLGGGIVLLHGTPNYYHTSVLTLAQRADAAARAESKLADMHNLVADAHGAELQKIYGAKHPATLPGARRFSFTEDELNALFNKWAELHGWKDLLERTVQDPLVILHDGKVIFAGKVSIKDVDTIVSIHLRPAISPDGQLDLKLESILGGKLPLPKETMIGPMRQKLLAQIKEELPSWQQRADIAADGATNGEAMKAAFAEVLVHTLQDEPSNPIIFLPLLSEGSRTVPAKLTDVTIADGMLSITVIPMASPDRSALLEEIKQPVTIKDDSQHP